MKLVLLFGVFVLVSGRNVEIRNLKLPEFDHGDEDLSLLEMTSQQGFPSDACVSNGDTHVSPFPDIYYTNVMGEREWMVVEGPTSLTVPKFYVQATQKVWQDCGRTNPHVTVIKDVAVQCGNAFVLITTPNYVSGCNQRKYFPDSEKDKIDFPKIFVKGKSVSGTTTYDGRDYSKDTSFQKGSPEVQLDTGYTNQAMKIKVLSNPCGKLTCKVGNVPSSDTYIEAQVTCADTRTYTFSYYGGGDWWSFAYLSVEVPRETQKSALIRQGATDGNLEGGYCGGWAPYLRNTLVPLHTTCRLLSPQGFYTESTPPVQCVKQFTTTLENSIFAKFEAWTNGGYNSSWTGTQAQVASAMSQDEYNAATAVCASLVKTQLPSVALTDSPKTAWELAVREKTKDCAEDRVFGLPMTGEQLKSQLCTVASLKIQQERKDIFCASNQFKSRCDTISPRVLATTISQAKAAEDVFNLRQALQAAKKSSLEVISSADNIAFWNVNECNSGIADSSNLNSTSCVDYRFIDTAKDMSDPDTAFIYGMLSSVDHKGQAIKLDSVLSTPTAVIILGAPSNVETDPAVPRVNRTLTGFTVYLAESKCSKSFAHEPEYVPYMVLDTEKTYTNFYLMQVVATSEWQTITYPAMENASVLATIQSINNAVENCCPAVKGYVTVRIKDVGTTSLSIRLQTDKLSEKLGIQVQRETVALMFIRGQQGTVSRIPWLAGRFRTAATIGNGVEPPTSTAQIALNSDSFKRPPFVFVQTITYDDPESMNLRTRSNILNNRYDFYMDEDTCDPDNTSRAHPAETVAYFALARL